MSGPVIEVDRLRKSFGSRVAVDDVSFSVAPGSVVGLLGPNGAGKTTVINCLTTLVKLDGGEASVVGHDVRSAPARVRANIAVTGQFAAVDEILTGRENLVFFGRLLRLNRTEARERAQALLEQFGMTEVADQKVRAYSGGMRRRLDLAVSLVVPRPVLFLDEPTTGLDPRSRQALWSVVQDLTAGGMAVLLTTQYLDEADELADRIVVMDEGRVIAEGTPEELKRRVGGSVCEVRLADAGVRARACKVLADLPGLAVREDSITLPVTGTGRLAEIVRRLDASGVEADDVAVRWPTLNDVFFALTDKSDEHVVSGTTS